MEKEIIDIKFEEQTGALLIPANQEDKQIISYVKLEAYKLLKESDFVKINGTWEAKRDGMLKILSSTPLSYQWKITDTEIKKEYVLVRGILILQINNILRKADGMGIVEPDEMKGKPLHFLVAKAETRALKRAIDTLFGSVINAYVINVLEKGA
ncbi:hypothetical protein JCM11957_07090 [Caminibacter profundus]